MWVVSRDVKKPILVLVLLIDTAHERGSRRKDLIDEDEDGLLRAELDALADDVDELAHRQVGGDQVLLLVDGRDVALLHLLADDLFVVCQYGDTTVGSVGSEAEVNVDITAQGMDVYGIRTGMRSAYF